MFDFSKGILSADDVSSIKDDALRRSGPVVIERLDEPGEFESILPLIDHSPSSSLTSTRESDDSSSSQREPDPLTREESYWIPPSALEVTHFYASE